MYLLGFSEYPVRHEPQCRQQPRVVDHEADDRVDVVGAGEGEAATDAGGDGNETEETNFQGNCCLS